MIKWLRNWLGLCDHRWVHGINVIDNYGRARQVQVCEKCLQQRLRSWR